jgi:hypothetical protein
MRVPSADAGQCISASASKERGKHAADECAEPLLVGAQTACNLQDQVVRYAQVIAGVAESFDVTLGLALLVLLAFLSVAATTMERFVRFFGVSLGGHGGFLRAVCTW